MTESMFGRVVPAVRLFATTENAEHHDADADENEGQQTHHELQQRRRTVGNSHGVYQYEEELDEEHALLQESAAELVAFFDEVRQRCNNTQSSVELHRDASLSQNAAISAASVAGSHCSSAAAAAAAGGRRRDRLPACPRELERTRRRRRWHYGRGAGRSLAASDRAQYAQHRQHA